MADPEDKKKEKEELKAQKKAEKKAKKAEKEAQKAEKPQEDASQADASRPVAGGILQWIIMAVIIIVLSGSGFFLGRIFAGAKTPKDPNELPKQQADSEQEPQTEEQAEDSGKTWYYEDLPPVVANPDVPGAMRYVRASLTLEMSSELPETKGTELLNAKKPVLIDWLNVYLKSLTLDDIRGDKNMKRIQAQILDAFNEQLFPDSRPKIKQILLKEFAVQ